MASEFKIDLRLAGDWIERAILRELIIQVEPEDNGKPGRPAERFIVRKYRRNKNGN